jgi:hypothetical protein
MSERKYLEPAYSLILKFSGPERQLRHGIDAVAAITGADRTRVYRWMRPKSAGGTGGTVPHRQADKLLAFAKRERMPVQAEDFFGNARTAA